MEQNQNMMQMPVLFVGHGSPQNITQSNPFTKELASLGKAITPKAILMISAHWMTEKMMLQQASLQKPLYDFYGFPKELYEVEYLPSGWSDEQLSLLQQTKLSFDLIQDRALDHGVWAVLMHMYPEANIPVVQLSMPSGLSFLEYFEIGQRLQTLRQEGVLIVGSGNIVHNLGQIDWALDADPKPWALEFDQEVKKTLQENNFSRFLDPGFAKLESFRHAHPTTEHWIPLMYCLGANDEKDHISFHCEFFQNASISMRSVLFS